MYRVLLVDDERIIREGIAKMIDWDSLGLSLQGTAVNGEEAAKVIEETPPDIVITDVKMPVLDGLSLIAMENERHPDIIFIVLSGYGEFELASGAMRYGVKHYLLKPCNERDIISALKNAVETLERREQHEALYRESQNYLKKMTPWMREQFLRDYMINGTYSSSETAYYCSLLNLEQSDYRVLILQIKDTEAFENLYLLRKILMEQFQQDKVSIVSIMANQLLVLLSHVGEDKLQDTMTDIRSKYRESTGSDFTASYSSEADINQLPMAYREAEQCLRFSFYLGEGVVISPKDIERENGEHLTGSFLFDYDKIGVAINSGNMDAVREESEAFFNKLKALACETNIAKTYCIELYLSVVRQCGAENIGSNLGKLAAIQQMDCIDKIRDEIVELSVKLAKENYDTIRSKQSKMVNTMIKFVRENIENEDLTLKYLANNVIYMNVGYLGRLFCKETGQKFSHYVMSARMEKAKTLIETCDDEKIYEVAKKIGLGDNPQYFSQLFKKHTGCTPSEYKTIRINAAKSHLMHNAD